jgi:hypothetical protein
VEPGIGAFRDAPLVNDQLDLGTGAKLWGRKLCEVDSGRPAGISTEALGAAAVASKAVGRDMYPLTVYSILLRQGGKTRGAMRAAGVAFAGYVPAEAPRD